MILVLATTTGLGLGHASKLPWKIPAEMAHFTRTTNNGIVIMGRKTYTSIPPKFRPLKNRINIIISRAPQEYAKKEQTENEIWAGNWSSAMQVAKELRENNGREIYVIGGAEIYRQAMPYVDKLMWTRITSKRHIECDVFAPSILVRHKDGQVERWATEDQGEANSTTEPIWHVVAEGGEGREGTHEDVEWKVFEMNRER